MENLPLDGDFPLADTATLHTLHYHKIQSKDTEEPHSMSKKRSHAEHDVNAKPYKCLPCDKAFPVEKSYKRHCDTSRQHAKQTGQGGGDSLQCTQCQHSFMGVGQRYDNQQAGAGFESCKACRDWIRDLYCRSCNKDFVRRYDKARHDGEQHGSLKVPCPKCNVPIRPERSATIEHLKSGYCQSKSSASFAAHGSSKGQPDFVSGIETPILRPNTPIMSLESVDRLLPEEETQQDHDCSDEIEMQGPMIRPAPGVLDAESDQSIPQGSKNDLVSLETLFEATEGNASAVHQLASSRSIIYQEEQGCPSTAPGQTRFEPALKLCTVDPQLNWSFKRFRRPVSGRRATRKAVQCCPLCRLPYERNEIDLRVHLERHLKEQQTPGHMCNECEIGFVYEEDLRMHQLSVAMATYCTHDCHDPIDCIRHLPPPDEKNHTRMLASVREWEHSQLREMILDVDPIISRRMRESLVRSFASDVEPSFDGRSFKSFFSTCSAPAAIDAENLVEAFSHIKRGHRASSDDSMAFQSSSHPGQHSSTSDLAQQSLQASNRNAKNFSNPESVATNRYRNIRQAVRKGHAPTVRMLIAHDRTSLNDRTRFNQTPLGLAAEFGQMMVAKALIELGADVEPGSTGAGWPDHVHQSPLHAAACHGHSSLAMLLVDHGADVNAKTRICGTVLQLSKDPVLSKMLLQRGADVNGECGIRGNPLFLAADRGDQLMIDALTAAKPAIRRGGSMNLTPLQVASRNGHVQAVIRLIEYCRTRDDFEEDVHEALAIATRQRLLYDTRQIIELLQAHSSRHAEIQAF